MSIDSYARCHESGIKRSRSVAHCKSVAMLALYGVPANLDILIDEQVNWTWGSISLKTNDVDEIYHLARVGTLVEIVP